MKHYNNKILVVLGLSILLLYLIFTCSKKTAIEPPEKHRQQFDWLNENFTVSAGYYKYFTKDLKALDTLDIEISLLQGDYIGYFFIADERNYLKWKAGDPYTVLLSRQNSTGGTFTVTIPIPSSIIPSYDKFYFVVYNTAFIVTIEVQARITVIRWTY